MWTNRNVDNQNVDKPKRRQTETSTDQNVDRPKSRQTEPLTNQNIDRPKCWHRILLHCIIVCVFIIGGCAAYRTIPQSMSTNKINSVVGGLSTAILEFKIISQTNTTMGFTKYKWYHRKSNMEVVPSPVVWLLVITWYINVNRVARPWREIMTQRGTLRHHKPEQEATNWIMFPELSVFRDIEAEWMIRQPFVSLYICLASAELGYLIARKQ